MGVPPDSDLAIWHLRLDPGARYELPAATGTDTVASCTCSRARRCRSPTPTAIDPTELGADTGAVLRADQPVALTAGASGAEILVLQGRPIGEPVAQYGPFVMNDEAEIRQAFADYRATEFGGWPWPTDDPVHGPERGRFARHADGRVEEAAALPTP